MPHSSRKVRQLRGSRSHGWGVRKHKGKGSHGGYGKSGGHKHKWSETIRFNINRYGKKGFHRPRSVSITTINVGALEEVLSKQQTSQEAVKKDEVLTINLNELGYDKLLGSGKVKRPLRVKVKASSQLASEKIEEAKGEVLIS